MGIINFFKNVKKEINNIKRQNAYIQMNTEEMAGLNDEELFQAVGVRIESKIHKKYTMEEGLTTLNEYEKAFYSTYYLETEVNNGGLCQYFVNSSRATAPYVSEGLTLIGAERHRKAFDDFVKHNNIDVTDLSSFIIKDVKEFEEQEKRYPFDEYDHAFYEMESIESYLIPFVRENLSML